MTLLALAAHSEVTPTSALLWLFAAAAVLLVAGFALATYLSYQHARTRRSRAGLLQTYIAGAQPSRGATSSRARLRKSVMHISIGDLVRDVEVADAVAAGLAKKSADPASQGPAA
jgi:hypothetical protein